MHDLRKKILLESGKTLSKKARAKPESTRSSVNHSPTTSPGGSRTGSQANSRPGSRYASEDEGASDSDYDEVMTMSTNSASGEDAIDDETNKATWTERLHDRLSELQDRKRSSVQGREATLTAYLHLLRHHFALVEIETSFDDIIAALMKSIRGGSSEEERSLALKALAVVILTVPSETVYELVYKPLRTVCEDAEEEMLKIDAIHALSIATMYGGGSETAAEELLDFLLEIIESDGHAVAAEDSGPVVIAALQSWAFVASHLDDISTQCEQAMEAFMDQLDSSDPEVQTSAGSTIALIFEEARDYEEETGETFDLQYNQHRIMTRMADIVRDSSKTISKKSRRHLRQNFTSIVTSLERGKGPGYSTAKVHPDSGAVDGEGNLQEFGYREKIRVHNFFMLIDTWSLQTRVETLKIVLSGGFAIHFMDNPVVKDMLDSPVIEYVSAATAARRKKATEVDDNSGKKGRRSVRSSEVF